MFERVHITLWICLDQVSFSDLEIISAAGKTDFICYSRTACIHLYTVSLHAHTPTSVNLKLYQTPAAHSSSVSDSCAALSQKSSSLHAVRVLTCLSVSSLVGDLVDGVQQTLLVTVGVQLKLCPGIVTELGNSHLSQNT